ncbi:MAG: phage resistance protein, partial [Candidatus Competibacterales bacterium]
GQVGQLKLSEDPSPLISLQLSGIDTESILQNARASDNEGNRKRLVRDMASQAFGIADAGQLFVEHPWTWRGTARSVDVVFQNVREIQDDSIYEPRGDHWKIIIDFPFDSDTYSPTDDQARIRDYQARGGQSRTLCWLPHFLSPEVQKNLGRLVILQEILKSDDSYSRYTSHLTPQDRASARALLDNQRSQLRQQLNTALLGAYGVATAAAGTLDNEDLLQSPIISLQPGFNPGLPHGTTMARALEQLLAQALSFQYPDHPPFEGTLRDGDLDKVLKEIRRAIHAENGRIEVDTSLRRPLRDIAQPLELGTMHERHFIYRDDWSKHLTREVAKTGHGTTIAALRAAMDQPQPRGLTPSVQNLLILIYAEAEQSAFTRGERTVAEVSLKHLPDDLVLVRQALAEAPVWRRALDNAGALFGIALPNTLRTAHNQKQLQDHLKPQLQRHRPGCNTLLATLTAKLQALGVSGEVDRLATARVAAALLVDLGGREGLELVEGLAEVQPATSLQALGRSMATATRIAEALEESNWPLLERVWRQGDGAGESIRQDLHNALAADELVTPLVDALKCAERTATQLLAPEPLPPAAPAPPPPPAAKGKIIRREARQGLDAQQAEQLLAELRQSLGPGITLDIHYTLTDQSNSHRP